MILNTTKSLFIASLCLFNCGSLYAQNYSSSQSATYSSSLSASDGNVYSSSNSSSPPPTSGYQSSINSAPTYHGHSTHESRNDISFSVNGPDFRARFSTEPDNSYFIENGRPTHHHRHFGPRWINAFQGDPLPTDLVMGGGDAGSVYYICHADYAGGVHPGKIVKGRCNFSWGGREIATNQYQVLVSHSLLAWKAAGFGYIPSNAVAGGYEQGKPLYICQAEYHQGMHPGKIIGENCNIAWGGKEIAIPRYNVLIG